MSSLFFLIFFFSDIRPQIVLFETHEVGCVVGMVCFQRPWSRGGPQQHVAEQSDAR